MGNKQIRGQIRIPKSELARGASVAFLLQLSNLGLTYIVQIFLARWMGTAEYGTYEYVVSWALLLAMLAELGLPNAVLRFIPEYKVKEDWGRLRGLLRGSWQLILGASLLLSLCGTAIVWWLGASQDWAYATPMLVGIWMVPLMALARLQLEMARGIQEIVLAYAPFRVIWHLLTLLGAFVLFQRNQELTSVPALAIAILALLTVVTLQLWLLRHRLKAAIRPVAATYTPRQWLWVALPLLLTQGFQIILGKTDILMIGAAMGAEAVGIYSAAAKTAIWVSLVLQSVNAVVAPTFSALYTQGDREGLQKLVSTVAHWIFWLSLIIALCLIIFARPILGIFGAEFVAARWGLTILVLGQLINVGVGSVGYLMIMTGHQNQSTYIFGFSALANVILNALLIPRFGTIGAAIATATTMALWNISLHFLVVKHLHVYPSIVANLGLAKLKNKG
ncbi:MAG: flippase [Cyanobacteria bacterium QH_2_48_84]|nr:MAG: flippase [Cyanobacteria bacterium QH_2_48_84]